MSNLLSEFPRRLSPTPGDTSSRVTAGLLTAVLYALFVLLIWRASIASPVTPAKSEVVAILLPDIPEKRAVQPLSSFLARLIQPRAERPTLPVFTIATGAPPMAPAPLPAPAVQSPMSGGTSGNGALGQAATGNGTNGNGATLAGCLDPVWMGAVTDQVRRFFYYPGPALALRTTGVVMVRFTVRRNGQIDKLEIARSSGDDGLDKAGTDIMRKAQPLPPIPDRMHVEQVDGELPINFGVRSFNGKPNMGNCGR